MTSEVQTVLGRINSSQLGVTMMHEHLLADAVALYQAPAAPEDKRIAKNPITIETINWLRYHFANHRDNLKQDDAEIAIDEAMMFKLEGGNTIVDCTVTGMSPNPIGLADISRATGLNVIAATGLYVQPSHSPDISQMSEENLAQNMIIDLTEGIDGSGIKAGIIGEIGCSWPLHRDERKAVVASSLASQSTGAAISIHPGRNEEAPKEIIDILLEAGARPEKIIMGHLDRTITDLHKLKELAETGCYLEYDLFGQDISFYPLAPHIARISDAQRIEFIEWLIYEGHINQIVLGQDAGAKVNLTKWGGHGYGHILRIVAPWMRQRGITDQQIRAMLVDNPKRALSIETEASSIETG